jgi:hypothetical protein
MPHGAVQGDDTAFRYAREMSNIRELVARVLDGHHLTQTELAAAMNVAQPVVSNWASGVRNPSRPHRDVAISGWWHSFRRRPGHEPFIVVPASD